MAERKILEDGDLHRPDKVKKRLEDMRTKRKSAARKAAQRTDRGTYIQQCADGLLHIMEQLGCLGQVDESGSVQEVVADESEDHPDLHLYART